MQQQHTTVVYISTCVLQLYVQQQQQLTTQAALPGSRGPQPGAAFAAKRP